ncbi:leucine-rich repeat domain-containing protein, partial [Streptomyces sp. NPDC056730]|uniref:leucine-rich repeat domain-containing protein n=1 Tax=Streptomyces sp. NPDC056730 TaxID=3345929 RepID=UPI0036C1FEC2
VLVLSNKALDELSFLRELPRLNNLTLSGCSALKDLSGLRESGIEVLQLEVDRLTHADLSPIQRMPELSSLRLTYGDSPLAQQLPTGHPRVKSLTIQCEKPIDFSSLPEWTSLSQLEIITTMPEGWEPDLPPLHGLRVTISPRWVSVPHTVVGDEILFDQPTVHD